MADKNDSKKTSEQKAPGFFQFVKKTWRSRSEEEEAIEVDTGVFRKFGKISKVIGDYQDAREKHEKNAGTYSIISEGSHLRVEFFILLICSAFIATFGLLQNSAAVIIGAMLIAPLMMPILGFSLGTIWGDKSLLGHSLITLFVGTLLVVGSTAAVSYVLPGVEFNEQMTARTNPNLYDILIALASGLVGAYAFVNPRISASISGVAIAVALVPPLSVTGISLGQFNVKAAYGSFLLYCSNLVGISLAASFVFWKMKVYPVLQDADAVDTRARRKFVLATIVLLLIAVPLGIFTKDSLYIKSHEKDIRLYVEKNLNNVIINELKVIKYVEKYKVICTLIRPAETNADEMKLFKEKVHSMFDKPVDIELIILRADIL